MDTPGCCWIPGRSQAALPVLVPRISVPVPGIHRDYQTAIFRETASFVRFRMLGHVSGQWFCGIPSGEVNSNALRTGGSRSFRWREDFTILITSTAALIRTKPTEIDVSDVWESLNNAALQGGGRRRRKSWKGGRRA